jgi:hypothetical protein
LKRKILFLLQFLKVEFNEKKGRRKNEDGEEEKYYQINTKQEKLHYLNEQ